MKSCLLAIAFLSLTLGGCHSGSGATSEVTEADTGMPFYPGSTPLPAGTSKEDGAAGSTTIKSARTTTDSPDKVLAFYRDKFTKADYEMATGGDQTKSIAGRKGDGDVITISALIYPDKSDHVEITRELMKS